jgi:hypothetical protein
MDRMFDGSGSPVSRDHPVNPVHPVRLETQVSCPPHGTGRRRPRRRSAVLPKAMRTSPPRNHSQCRQCPESGTDPVSPHAPTAASIAAMSIFICCIIAAIALADTFLSAFVVNSARRFGYTCHETP